MLCPYSPHCPHSPHCLKRRDNQLGILSKIDRGYLRSMVDVLHHHRCGGENAATAAPTQRESSSTDGVNGADGFRRKRTQRENRAVPRGGGIAEIRPGTSSINRSSRFWEIHGIAAAIARRNSKTASRTFGTNSSTGGVEILPDGFPGFNSGFLQAPRYATDSRGRGTIAVREAVVFACGWFERVAFGSGTARCDGISPNLPYYANDFHHAGFGGGG